MTKIQSSRAIGIALMVVLFLALALPVAGQGTVPVLSVTYGDGSTTETPGSPTGGDTWHFNVFHTGMVVTAQVTMPEGTVISWNPQNGAHLVDPCGSGGGQASWHWVLAGGQNLVISDASCTPLSVVLNDFGATCQVDEIVVTWETGSEYNNLGFNLIRGLEGMGTTVEIWFVPSLAPGSGQGASYTFIDSNIIVGQSYAYSLESIDLVGGTVRYGPVVASCEPPTALRLTTLSAEASDENWNGRFLLKLVLVALALLVASIVMHLINLHRRNQL
jgi:hypothetical protein